MSMRSAKRIAFAAVVLAFGAWMVFEQGGRSERDAGPAGVASGVLEGSGAMDAAKAGDPGREADSAEARADRTGGEVDSVGTSAARALPPGSEPEPRRPLTLEQFEELAASVNQSLPTLETMRGVGEAGAHGAPVELREAGLELGRIARALQDNPSLGQAALGFYGNCAERADLPRSIRALCYSNYKSGALKTLDESLDDEEAGPGDGSEMEDYEVPASVESLAQELE